VSLGPEDAVHDLNMVAWVARSTCRHAPDWPRQCSAGCAGSVGAGSA
jgi:hypothetical protein